MPARETYNHPNAVAQLGQGQGRDWSKPTGVVACFAWTNGHDDDDDDGVVVMPTSRSKVLTVRAMSSVSSSSPSETSSWLEAASSMADI